MVSLAVFQNFKIYKENRMSIEWINWYFGLGSRDWSSKSRREGIAWVSTSLRLIILTPAELHSTIIIISRLLTKASLMHFEGRKMTAEWLKKAKLLRKKCPGLERKPKCLISRDLYCKATSKILLINHRKVLIIIDLAETYYFFA